MSTSTSIEKLFTLSELVGQLPTNRNQLIYIIQSRNVRPSMIRSGVHFYGPEAMVTIRRAVEEIANRRRPGGIPRA
jgi:hypothetical protein